MKVEKKNQAWVVVYHLEGHMSGIQKQINETLGDEINGKETGMEKLIANLDSMYAKDHMTDV